MRPFRSLLATLLVAALVLALATSASADDPQLEQAKEEAGATQSLPSRYDLPAGILRIDPAELVAAHPGQEIRFTVTLNRDAGDAGLEVRLPATWVRHASSGLPFADPPDELAGGSSGRSAFDRTGRDVELAFHGGHAGDEASFAVRDVGIPAGTYKLPLTWRAADGSTTDARTADVAFYAPPREGAEDGRPNPWSRVPNPGAELPVIADAEPHPETAIVTAPGNPDRLGVGANFGSAVSISDNGGLSYTRSAPMSSTVLVRGGGTESVDPGGDPTLAGDSAGNIWYSELGGSGASSRILVARIPAGSTEFQPTVGLDRPAGSDGLQDKNLLTIDSDPSSPTYGRLYLGWGAPVGAATDMVVSQCDTRPGGVSDPANCDNPNNWSPPATVYGATGSNIFADPAVGPDGKVYFTWWDYSSTNAVVGSTCDAGGGADCTQSGNWSAPQTIATLDDSFGTPVPFACPILAVPGGRVSPQPQIAVDESGNPTTSGRVYVTWGDLRPGSGTTKCEDPPPPPTPPTPPSPTDLTWDQFVASAANALPGGNGPSTTVGTKLYDDGDPVQGSVGGNSDEFFTWLAVDQTRGQAYFDLYSTRLDPTRHQVNFFASWVTPKAGGHDVGRLTRVSSAPSDHSDTPCCNFANDYGDYEGLDTTGDFIFPVWADRRTGGNDQAYVATERRIGANLSAAAASFGGQTTGTQSGPQGITLATSGLLPVTTGSVSLGGTNPDQFSVSNGCSNQVLDAAHPSCTANVTFAPTATGTQTATLLIPSDAPGAPHTVALTGTGTAPGPGGGGGATATTGTGPTTTGVTPPPGPGSAFTIASRRTSRRGVIVLGLGAPQPGTFSATAAGVAAYRAPLLAAVAKRNRRTRVTYGRGTAAAAAAGPVTLTIKPGAAARKLLAKGKRIALTVAVTFRPVDGSAPSSGSAVVRVKGVKKRKRRR